MRIHDRAHLAPLRKALFVNATGQIQITDAETTIGRIGTETERSER